MKHADCESECDTDGIGGVAESPHEEDADAHEAHARRLSRRGADPERDHSDEEHQHRGGAARDRIDERQLGASVGSGEEDDIAELEEPRHNQIRNRLRVQPPGQGSYGRVRDQRYEEGDCGRRLRILRARHEQVPEGVQEGRGQSEGEGGGRHGGSLSCRWGDRAP